MLSYKDALQYELEILVELLNNSTDETQADAIIEVMVAITKYLNELDKKPSIC